MRALADHLLGRPIVEGGQVVDVRWGTQPYEGILSVICESFHCLPDEAERQNWQEIQAILDYRMAATAVDASNRLQGGEALDDGLQAMLDRMQEAQNE